MESVTVTRVRGIGGWPQVWSTEHLPLHFPNPGPRLMEITRWRLAAPVSRPTCSPKVASLSSPLHFPSVSGKNRDARRTKQATRRSRPTASVRVMGKDKTSPASCAVGAQDHLVGLPFPKKKCVSHSPVDGLSASHLRIPRKGGTTTSSAAAWFCSIPVSCADGGVMG